MKFLIDQNLPVRLIDVLRDLGHEADHVKILGLAQTSDVELWQLASDTNAIVISKNRDFLAIAGRSATTQGLVHLNVGNCPNAILYDAVRDDRASVVARLETGVKIVELRL